MTIKDEVIVREIVAYAKGHPSIFWEIVDQMLANELINKEMLNKFAESWNGIIVSKKKK